jgi:hypothetical protein
LNLRGHPSSKEHFPSSSLPDFFQLGMNKPELGNFSYIKDGWRDIGPSWSFCKVVDQQAKTNPEIQISHEFSFLALPLISKINAEILQTSISSSIVETADQAGIGSAL